MQRKGGFVAQINKKPTPKKFYEREEEREKESGDVVFSSLLHTKQDFLWMCEL